MTAVEVIVQETDRGVVELSLIPDDGEPFTVCLQPKNARAVGENLYKAGCNVNASPNPT